MKPPPPPPPAVSVTEIQIPWIEFWVDVRLSGVSRAALAVLSEREIVEALGGIAAKRRYQGLSVAQAQAKWRRVLLPGMPSLASLLAWMRSARRQGEITVRLRAGTWQNIEFNASDLGLTPAEVCLAAIGWIAACRMTEPVGV